MIRPRDFRWRLALCGAAITLVVAGCTSQAADGATTSGAPERTVTPSVASVTSGGSASPATLTSSPASPSSPPRPSSTAWQSSAPASTKQTSGAKPSTNSTTPSAREKADRAAVEKAWARFLSVNDDLVRTPEASRVSQATAVAVDPTLSQMLKDAKQFASAGIDYYGSAIPHPYWERPIAAKSTAVMGDCSDTSDSGSFYTATGKKKTVGVPDNNTRVTFVKDESGAWRVAEIFYLIDVKC